MHTAKLLPPDADFRQHADEVMPAGITRTEVARRLRISMSSVRKMEKDGRLRPIVGEDGVHRFQVADLANARLIRPPNFNPQRLSPAQRDALAFKRFSEGRNIRDVVIELEMAPERARDLYAMWESPDCEPPPHREERRRRR